MNSLELAGIVFACCFGGALAGIFLQTKLPASHLSSQSQTVVTLAMGLIASMAALVLGLLVAAATSRFDEERNDYEGMATNLVLLDRALAHYGPETQHAREVLRQTVLGFVQRLDPAGETRSLDLGSSRLTAGGNALFDAIRDLAPTNDLQRAVQSQAIQTCIDLGRARWKLSHHGNDAIPSPFLVVLTFWLAMLFVSFGLYAPPNATVIVVLLVCAISMAGAIFLIVDLGEPLGGLIHLSDAPIREALAQLGQ